MVREGKKCKEWIFVWFQGAPTEAIFTDNSFKFNFLIFLPASGTIGIFARVQIQKEVIADLKREIQFL